MVEADAGSTSSDTRFLWCGPSICEARDDTGASVTKRYFAQGAQEASTAYFYTRDHLGSVRELSDGTNTVRARYDYDPWGRRTKISGDKETDFGYARQYQHGSSALSLTLFRGFDPNAGRWISEDPIGLAGGVNLDAYVGNRPSQFVDPLGLYTGVDDAIFTTGGFLLGLASQGLSDLIVGELSGFNDYAGAAVGGAVSGELLLYAGPGVAGAAGSVLGNLTTQWLKLRSGQQCAIDAVELTKSGVVGGVLGEFGSLVVSRFSAGSNSFNAIFNQMRLKLSAGTISNVSFKTGLKMFLGRGTATGLFGSVPVAADINAVDRAAKP